jgi:hypothetical protein
MQYELRSTSCCYVDHAIDIAANNHNCYRLLDRLLPKTHSAGLSSATDGGSCHACSRLFPKRTLPRLVMDCQICKPSRCCPTSAPSNQRRLSIAPSSPSTLQMLDLPPTLQTAVLNHREVDHCFMPIIRHPSNVPRRSGMFLGVASSIGRFRKDAPILSRS